MAFIAMKNTGDFYMKSKYISDDDPQAYGFLMWAKIFTKEYELSRWCLLEQRIRGLDKNGYFWNR